MKSRSGWPLRRKFHPDEADFTDYSDRSLWRSGSSPLSPFPFLLLRRRDRFGDRSLLERQFQEIPALVLRALTQRGAIQSNPSNPPHPDETSVWPASRSGDSIQSFRINIHSSIDVPARRINFPGKACTKTRDSQMIQLPANYRNLLRITASIRNRATGRFCAGTNTDS